MTTVGQLAWLRCTAIHRMAGKQRKADPAASFRLPQRVLFTGLNTRGMRIDSQFSLVLNGSLSSIGVRNEYPLRAFSSGRYFLSRRVCRCRNDR